jgi:hypothetical protein
VFDEVDPEIPGSDWWDQAAAAEAFAAASVAEGARGDLAGPEQRGVTAGDREAIVASRFDDFA